MGLRALLRGSVHTMIDTAYRSMDAILGISSVRMRYTMRVRRDARMRNLEIGPGASRIAGFETIDIEPKACVDYVADVGLPLPFPDGTFDLIYASHVLEHIPWYQTSTVLQQWVRVLKPGAPLEVWVPDGLKICKMFVDAEERGVDPFERDFWPKLNPERDPCLWASGRLYTYGDGRGTPEHPNWHRAVFSMRYLSKLMREAGLDAVGPLAPTQVRGHDHGWISLGVRGQKP